MIRWGAQHQSKAAQRNACRAHQLGLLLMGHDLFSLQEVARNPLRMLTRDTIGVSGFGQNDVGRRGPFTEDNANVSTRAAIEVYPFLASFLSERRGLLNPKSSEIRHFLWCLILVVYLGHGIFHPLVAAVLVFFKSVFGGDLKLPNRGISGTKWCTSIVARVYRLELHCVVIAICPLCTRLKPFKCFHPRGSTSLS